MKRITVPDDHLNCQNKQTKFIFSTLIMQTPPMLSGIPLRGMSVARLKLLFMFTNYSRKTFTLLCSLFLALVFVGTSCKKDDEKSLEDLLTAHAWKQTGESWGGTPQAIEPCTADDIVEFTDDNKYHFDEGTTKCDESDPQETHGTWSISESTSPATLTVSYEEDGTTETLEWKLTELTSSKMVWSSELPIIGTYELTFEKK